MASRKPLSYSAHALTVVHERQLKKEWVEVAVHEPQWRLPGPHYPDRERRFRMIAERGDRVLRVVVVETEEEIRIVTTILERRARKPEGRPSSNTIPRQTQPISAFPQSRCWKVRKYLRVSCSTMIVTDI